MGNDSILRMAEFVTFILPSTKEEGIKGSERICVNLYILTANKEGRK